jgi:hypothetical protein
MANMAAEKETDADKAAAAEADKGIKDAVRYPSTGLLYYNAA